MKKLLAMLLVLCLVCCSSALALRGEAEGTTDDNTITGNTPQEAETKVTVTISENYTVVIPPTVPITFNTVDTPITIKVSDLRLLPGNLLYVQPQDYGTLTDAATTKTLAYTLEGLTTKGDVSALFFDADGDAAMNINIPADTWNATPAGNYQGTISFKIAIGTF